MNNIDIKLLGKVAKLSPQQRGELDMVLTKFLSKEPITDEERRKDPEVWARAEKYFKFKLA